MKPETSTGWDLGLQYHTPNNELTATIEYFHNRFNKLIDLDPDLLNQGLFQLTNLDEALTKGMEFSLTLSPKAPVSFQANLTYLTTRVGGYTKADATLTYRPTRAWRWYTALENLTNVSYEEFRGFPGPPLTFRVGIEYLFSDT